MNYALVTGASRGIGRAFAEALAAEGWPLILTSRRREDLEPVRQGLLARSPDIQCVTADLHAGGAAQLAAWLAESKLAVDLLVNNAGLGSGGEFARLPLERELEEVRVNIAALVELTHACLPGMRARGSGAVINVASLAGMQPVPYLATYAATKAFVVSFSVALYEEMRRQGVHVMALCPGPVRTEFFKTAGARPRQGKILEPAQVAALGLRGWRRRDPVVLCTGADRALVALERMAPRRALAAAVGAVMRRRWETGGS